MGTTNMNLTQSSVGVTSGPDWATNTESNWTAIDTHDHSSGKGVQISPAGININADLEFNANDATELRTVAFESSASATTSADRRCIYQYDGDIWWRNASGTAVQITSGTAVGSGVGSIDGMGGTQAKVQYNDTAGQKSFSFIHDKSTSPDSVAKMAHADLNLYNFSNSNYYVQLKYLGSGSSETITVPDETGTMLTSASSVPDISVTSTTASKPIFTLANNANDATSATINLKNLRGGSNAGVAGDDAGTINFYANDAANNNQIYSTILAEISDPTSGGEEGKISISVAEYDGTVTPGFILTGSAVDGVVEATIGAGAGSTTTIAGNIDITDGNIVNVGDIDCDSISCADAANGLDINFNANTGTNKISLTDNLASALDITEAGNSYIKFVTTNSSEQIVIGKNSTFSGTTIADLGTVTTADINGGTWQGTIDGSWTAASQTCANLGTVTTADLNGGTIDGMAINGSTIQTSSISTSDVTVGAGKTLNVSAGTLTTSTAQKQAIVDGADIEGTDILSTGESGAEKFLREDGDGTCSWQAITGIPAGMIAPFGMTSAPTGWLLCDGSSVSTSTYSALHSAIGYSWGGSGANFNVPDLRGAHLRGVGTSTVFTQNQTVSLASTWSDATQNATGTVVDRRPSYSSASGVFANTGSVGAQWYDIGGTGVGFNFDLSRQVRTANETRPNARGVQYMIKI